LRAGGDPRPGGGGGQSISSRSAPLLGHPGGPQRNPARPAARRRRLGFLGHACPIHRGGPNCQSGGKVRVIGLTSCGKCTKTPAGRSYFPTAGLVEGPFITRVISGRNSGE